MLRIIASVQRGGNGMRAGNVIGCAVLALHLGVVWQIFSTATAPPHELGARLDQTKAGLAAASIQAHNGVTAAQGELNAMAASGAPEESRLRADIAAALELQRQSTADLDGFVATCSKVVNGHIGRDAHRSTWSSLFHFAREGLSAKTAKNSAAAAATTTALAALRAHFAAEKARADAFAAQRGSDAMVLREGWTATFPLVFSKGSVDEVASGTEIARLLEFASACEALRVELRVGGPSIAVGKAHANAVRKFLLNRGVARNRIASTVGELGEPVLSAVVVERCPIDTMHPN